MKGKRLARFLFEIRNNLLMHSTFNTETTANEIIDAILPIFLFFFSVWRNIVSTTQVDELDIETKIIKNTSSE